MNRLLQTKLNRKDAQRPWRPRIGSDRGDSGTLLDYPRDFTVTISDEERKRGEAWLETIGPALDALVASRGERNKNVTAGQGGERDPGAPDKSRTCDLRFRKPVAQAYGTRFHAVNPDIGSASNRPNPPQSAQGRVTDSLQSQAFAWFCLGAFFGALAIVFVVWLGGRVSLWGWL